MDYKVSALKYRPNEFSKVIGQNHVTDTLKNYAQTGSEYTKILNQGK